MVQKYEVYLRTLDTPCWWCIRVGAGTGDAKQSASWGFLDTAISWGFGHLKYSFTFLLPFGCVAAGTKANCSVFMFSWT